MKKTQALEKVHTKALNHFSVNEFFDVLGELIKEYNIMPGNIYNMDEKGIQLGIGARVTAMVDRDQTTVYSVEDGNRELVTVIEAVCADGSALHPSVIFQGQRRNSEWGCNNPSNARYCFLYLTDDENSSHIWSQHFYLSEQLDRSGIRLSIDSE